ncbi:alpha/beta hydrolase [Kutzneria sp. NPDC052558]|uniref:alpha/beta hydrolase n=1 Tax=Kutzneria sp. NPDC052558 TaxID=3364121 RepID=UPI0037CC29B0
MISRRLFAQGFAGVLAAGTLAACSSDTAAAPAASAAGHTTFPSLKQIQAGPLDVGYAEAGPADGQPVFLLHGWPYDIHAYVDVAPILAAAGYRVIVPFLRGYGATTFLYPDTVRNGQQAATASDLIALMDALHVDKAVLAGYDWGGRTATCVAAIWPERVKAATLVSGYLINNLAANRAPLAPAAERGWWYQFYFATDRGVAGYTHNRHDFNKLIWTQASPDWKFTDDTYNRSAKAFDNPDHVAVVIHNYRWRLGLADGEQQYAEVEQKLQASPVITVPTITVGSDFDGAAIDGKGYRDKFTGKYEHRVFKGIGHNVPQETPQDFAKAVMDADRL